MSEDRQKLILAQRGLQNNSLAREVAAIIEAAGISEIADRNSASKNFNAISGAYRQRRRRIRFVSVGGCAHSSANRSDAG